ncbi:AAA family ATPase [Cloacibacillus evryensis]|uniref:AAA family ATPase n=1 Tax=Cloacibacillus evryensis TaxID=508460 RepID=UPI0018DC8A5E
MYIKRDRYLNQLISRHGNGQIKIITGVRQCGKSFLLFKIFCDHLKSTGVCRTTILFPLRWMMISMRNIEQQRSFLPMCVHELRMLTKPFM